MGSKGKADRQTGKFMIIAVLCFVTYLACYATKSLLSVNSPQMIENGYTSAQIGTMSSVYFLLYGAGQLFTGLIGDRVKMKYMLLAGLMIAAGCCTAFVLFDSVAIKTVAWGACGFGLSFLYAPLVRSVSDRLKNRQAEICMVVLNLASVMGATAAGVFGAFGNWKTATSVFAAMLGLIAVASLITNLVLDKKYPVICVAEDAAVPSGVNRHFAEDNRESRTEAPSGEKSAEVSPAADETAVKDGMAENYPAAEAAACSDQTAGTGVVIAADDRSADGACCTDTVEAVVRTDVKDDSNTDGKQGVALNAAGVMPFRPFLKYWLSTGGIVFILVSCIQGIAKNSITFWIPTYISQYLDFTPQIASIIFSVMTLLAALNQIIAIALYHMMKNKAIRVIRFSFLLSTVCFLLLIAFDNVWLNLILLLIAKSGYSWAGTMIWTFYCRSYKSVGRVAFVVGFLDFVSYVFSAFGSLLFSDAIESIGWLWLIVVWSGIMLVGAVSTFLFRKTTAAI